MAMSDLLFSILICPWELAQLYVNSWLTSGSLGQALCKLAPLADISSVVSIQSLVLIAVDRFGAVVFPLCSPLICSKPCTFFTFASWIIAMAVILPYFVAYKLVEYAEGEFSCELQRNEAFGEASSIENYYIALYLVFNFIPVALLTILYSIILIKLKTQKLPGKPSANAEQQRAKRNRSVLKLAIAIVLGFVLCWVPWSVINLLIVLAWDSRLPCAFVLYYDIAWFMALSNCAINPCICFIFSENYRQGLRRILKCFGAVQE